MTIPELEELVDLVLRRHHDVEARMLEELEARLQSSSLDQRIVAPFTHLFNELLSHMEKEETVLFPALRQLAAGEAVDVSCPLQAMEREHNQIQTLEAALRASARDGGDLEPLILDLVDDLEEHMRLEEEELFPMARSAMAAAAAHPKPTHSREVQSTPMDKGDSALALRHTRSICPSCLIPVPATVERQGSSISLVQRCSAHGDTRTVLSENADYWSDLDTYYFSLGPWGAPQQDYQVVLSEHQGTDCGCKLDPESSPRCESGPEHLSAEAMLARQRGSQIELIAPSLDEPDKVVTWVEKVHQAGHTPVLRAPLDQLAREGLTGKLASAGLDRVIAVLAGPLDGETAEQDAPLSRAEARALSGLREASIEVELVVAMDTEGRPLGPVLDWCLQPQQDHIFKITLTNHPQICGSGNGHSWTTDSLARHAIHHFSEVGEDELLATNKLYFALAHAFDRKRCLYQHHSLLFRDGHGGYRPLSHYMDPSQIHTLAEQYRVQVEAGRPRRARLGLICGLLLQGSRPRALTMLPQAVGLVSRMSRTPLPRPARHRSLVLSFVTSCHGQNYDESVAHGCRFAVLDRDKLGSSSRALFNLKRAHSLTPNPVK